MNALRQPALLSEPMLGLVPIAVHEANEPLAAWEHRLGPVHRPFRQEVYVLELDGEPVSVAVSGSIVSNGVAGYRRDEVVECTRLCSDPEQSWATRIMLRLWREVCAPREEAADDEQVIRIIDASDGWQKAYLCPACRHDLGSDLQCSNCRRARAFGLWLSHEIERFTRPIQSDDGGADMFETHRQRA